MWIKKNLDLTSHKIIFKNEFSRSEITQSLNKKKILFLKNLDLTSPKINKKTGINKYVFKKMDSTNHKIKKIWI